MCRRPRNKPTPTSSSSVYQCAAFSSRPKRLKVDWDGCLSARVRFPLDCNSIADCSPNGLKARILVTVECRDHGFLPGRPERTHEMTILTIGLTLHVAPMAYKNEF